DDADGDGHSGMAEFALGSDLGDPTDMPEMELKLVKSKERPEESYLELTFEMRTDASGVSGELQHSPDGKTWKSVEDDFVVVERVPLGDGIVRMKLRGKSPFPKNAPVGLCRIVVAR
ncbi:MAG: hypothetical protein AAF514_21855, partial [Verrucomicrobiota bacterium]